MTEQDDVNNEVGDPDLTNETPRIKDLDFSHFHPMDHWIWEPRCWSRKVQPSYSVPFKGGPWHHIKLSWEFKYRDRVLGHWFRRVQCRKGKHHWTWFDTGPRTRVRKAWCPYCFESRPMTAEELEQHPVIWWPQDPPREAK